GMPGSESNLRKLGPSTFLEVPIFVFTRTSTSHFLSIWERTIWRELRFPISNSSLPPIFLPIMNRTEQSQILRFITSPSPTRLPMVDLDSKPRSTDFISRFPLTTSVLLKGRSSMWTRNSLFISEFLRFGDDYLLRIFILK